MPKPQTFGAAFRSSIADSRWILFGEAAVNSGGYLCSIYLWATGAATWQVLFVGAMSAALTVLLTLYHGQQAWQSEHDTVVELERLAQAHLDGRPNMILERIANDRAITVRKTGFGKGPQAHVWQLWFLNKPVSIDGLPAMGAMAEVEFFDAGLGQTICRFDGQWARTEAPSDVQWIDLDYRWNFSPRVEIAKLNLLVQTDVTTWNSAGQKTCDVHALSRETVEAFQEGLADAAFDLSQAAINSTVAYVRIRGENFETQDFAFRIHRLPDGSVQAIEPIES